MSELRVDRRIAEISDSIRPMLAGLGPDMQGAVLADLVSMFLAGFQGPDAPAVRKELLQLHVRTVRKLIPDNEKALLDRLARGPRQ